MVQPAPPVDVRDRFAPLHDALVALLDALPSDQWERPTACPGWTVHDLALHLLGGDVGIVSRGRDGFSRERSSGTGWSDLVAFVNERNDAWVTATRRMSPRVVCDFLRITGPQVTAHFQSLDMHALGNPVSWAGGGPAPVWLDVAREYTERWHHQQQIREAVGAPDLLQPFFLAPALATFVRALPVAYRDVEAAEGTTVALRIVGEAGQTWLLHRIADTWQLGVGLRERPTSTVTLPEDIAWRLFTNGLKAHNALRHTTITGDERLGRHVLDAVAIIA